VPTRGLTPKQRILRAQLAAFSLHARVDSRKHTEPARAAFLAKFEDEVDPGRLLPESERLRRAEVARKAHFAKLAYLSSRSRASRKTSPPRGQS
jgi:hypothetical protein